jgi:ornithine cyclodeaminase/alanine dehydrogenase-like protein (mu-crystallin family)
MQYPDGDCSGNRVRPATYFTVGRFAESTAQWHISSEAAELIDLANAGALAWNDVHEIGDVVTGKVRGRASPADLTLFKSLGIALEDVALAELILRRAVDAGAGRTI